jgi:cytochrome c oxidase assembly protein subunit 15
VVLAHLGIWGFAAAFLIVLLVRARGRAHLLEPCLRTARVLAVAAFIGVSLQATLGGLRVTQETAGLFDLAMVLRIVHGCVAQAELCVLVTLATVLARPWQELREHSLAVTAGLKLLAWVATAAIYVQLIVGAVMRHLGAGLAIPSFPAASPTGSLLPAAHNKYIDTNFTHTRVGALLITILVVTLAVRVLRLPGAGPRLRRPAWLALALLVFQISLGVSLIWHFKPPTPTTVHVVNGALLLATSLLLSLRLQRVSAESDRAAIPAPIPSPEEERLSRAIAS